MNNVVLRGSAAEAVEVNHVSHEARFYRLWLNVGRLSGKNDRLRVLLPESLPSAFLNIAVLAINLLGYSAMAGAIGGGGLGDLAIKYGYYRFQGDVMLYSVIILVILVQIIQSVCTYIYRRLR